MTSQKQVEANRRNAALSTGARTEEGQAVSSMNALRHGLTAKAPVVPTENQDEFDRFREALIEDLAPVGALEERIAEEIIDLSWRLRRATVLEQGILAGGVAAGDERFFSKQKAQFEITERQVREAELAAAVGLDDTIIQIINPHVHELLEEQLDEAASVKRTEEVRLAGAFIDDANGPNAMAKLTRHETSLFRRRNQALVTLNTLQQARTANAKGERVTSDGDGHVR